MTSNSLFISHLKSGHPQELTQRGKKSLRKGRSRFPTLLAKCRNCKLKQHPLGYAYPNTAWKKKILLHFSVLVRFCKESSIALGINCNQKKIIYSFIFTR